MQNIIAAAKSQERSLTTLTRPGWSLADRVEDACSRFDRARGQLATAYRLAGGMDPDDPFDASRADDRAFLEALIEARAAVESLNDIISLLVPNGRAGRA